MTARFLDLEDLLSLVRALGIGPVRDVGLVASAAARPRTTVFGDDAYPSIPMKAAALLHSLTKNHPLIDGNKRLAWLACVVFLDINCLQPDLSDDEAFTLVMDVATGRLDEISDIAAALNVVAA